MGDQYPDPLVGAATAYDDHDAVSGATEALVELHDQALRFLRDAEQRLLHVITTASLRGAVVELLVSLEANPLAPGPFVQLDTPHGTADPGWTTRADTLRRNHEARRETSTDDPWPLLAVRPASRGLAGFAEQLAQLVAHTPGQRPWAIVFAPGHIKAPTQWARGVAMLLEGTGLADIRWIVVDVDGSSLGEAVADEKVRRTVQCIPKGGDGSTADAHPLKVALAGATGALGARLPELTPPPRPGQLPPTPPTPEEDKRSELASLIADASASASADDGAKAVEHQRKARDLCVDAGWTDMAVSMELVLGGYLLAAKADTQAELSHRRAIERAANSTERADLLPLSQLSLGSTLMARGDRPAAMLAYSEATASAEKAGSAPLTIESCRLTGDTAMLVGMEAQAIAFWSKAVSVALTRPHEASLASGSHCARALALVCKQRRLTEEAERYWDAARDLDGVDLPTLTAAQAQRDKDVQAYVDAEVANAEATEHARTEAALAARTRPPQDEPAAAEPPAKEPDNALAADSVAAAEPAPQPDITPQPNAASETSAKFDEVAAATHHEGPLPALPEPPSDPAAPPHAPLSPAQVRPRTAPISPPSVAAPPPAVAAPPPAVAAPPPDVAAASASNVLTSTQSEDSPAPSSGTLAGADPLHRGSSGTVALDAGSSPSAPIDEGTLNVSVEELAALHWKGAGPVTADGAPLPPPTVVHEWTDEEQDAIRKSTSAVLNEESTALLSPEEVIALLGQASLPPAREPSPEATAIVERATAVAMLKATDPEAEGTSWISEDALSSVRARFGHRIAPAAVAPAATPRPAIIKKKVAASPPPARPIRVAPRNAGDEATMVTPERVQELARRAAELKKKKPEE